MLAGHVTRLQIGEGRELVVAARAVQLTSLLERLRDVLVAVVLALFQLEERAQGFRADDFVAFEIELADAVTLAFRDGNPQLHPARLSVLGVLHHLQLGLTDLGEDVPLVPVVLLNRLRVLGELLFLVGPAAGDEAEEALLFVLLHVLLQGAVGDRLVADEVDVANLHLGAFGYVEGHVHELRPAVDRLDLVLDLGELVTLGRVQLAYDPGDAAKEARIDERVEADRDAFFLQLLVDLVRVDLLVALVVDDLDPLPLLHVVDDDLPHHAIGEGVIDDLNAQVVQEVRRPQPLEVRHHRLLGGLVVRHPSILGRGAAPELDVVEVRVGLDDRRAALLVEAEQDLVDDRPGPRRGRFCRYRNGQVTNGGRGGWRDDGASLLGATLGRGAGWRALGRRTGGGAQQSYER